MKRNGRELHALMGKFQNTLVDNVEVLYFAFTTGKNTNAKNAEGVRSANTEDRDINAKTVKAVVSVNIPE